MASSINCKKLHFGVCQVLAANMDAPRAARVHLIDRPLRCIGVQGVRFSHAYKPTCLGEMSAVTNTGV